MFQRCSFVVLLLTFAISFPSAFAQSLGFGDWQHQDIGTVGAAGNASYSNGTFTVTGAGADIWNTADGFHFVYETLTGDGEIVARVASVQNTNAWAKAGVTLRQSLNANSQNVSLVVSPTSGLAFQWRSSTGGTSSNTIVSGAAPSWVKLIRSANNILGYKSSDGLNWTFVGATTVSMSSTLYVGLAVTSHSDPTLNTSSFDGVAVTSYSAPPAPWAQSDIGAVGTAGTGTYANGTFAVAGAGADIQGTSDAFHFVYQTLVGDGEVVARVGIVQNTNGWAKAGVMLRQSLNANSQNAAMLVTPSNGLAFQSRSSAGGSTGSTGISGSAPAWVKLVRSANNFLGYKSSDGSNWTFVGATTISMSSTIYVGLAVTSHNNPALSTSVFDNVAITTYTAPSAPWTQTDIGAVGVTGGSSYDNGTFTVTGSGSDIGGTTDAFHCVSQYLTGDGVMVARVKQTQNTSSSAKIGLMLRQSVDPNSPHASILLTPGSGMLFLRRTVAGGSSTTTSNTGISAPQWLKLQRSGNMFTGYRSSDGTSWVSVGTDTLSMNQALYFCLAVSSNNNSVLNTSIFDNVTVTGAPAVPPSISGSTPASGPIGTRVTIAGTHFGDTAAGNVVTFNGVAASVISWSDTQIVANVPMTATTGPIIVQVAGVQSNTNVGFTVVPNNPPSVSITSPADQSVLTNSTPITITANVSDVDGDITKVEFFDGSVKLGESSNPPYSFSLSNAPTGWHSLTAKATDNSATTTTSVAANVAVVLVGNWFDQDVGAVWKAGTASYTNGAFTAQGYGDIERVSADAFHFIYQPLTGDGTIIARVANMTSFKAGVMIRETLTAGSKHMFMGYSGGSFQYVYRTTTGAQSTAGSSTGSLPGWVKLVRQGNLITSYKSSDATNWFQLTSQSISMAPEVYVGLEVNSNTTTPPPTGTLDYVSVTSSAVAAPAIASVSATTATVGDQVTISGSGFGDPQGSSAVLLNGASMPVSSWNDNSITFTIAAGASSGYLVVCTAPTMNNSNSVAFTVTAQPLPTKWLDQDVGAVYRSGVASYANGLFTIAGYGELLRTTADRFHFVYQPLHGDGTIVARVANTSATHTALMIRESMATDANMIWVGSVQGGNETAFRTTPGSQSAYQSGSSGGVPYWFKLSRSGNYFSSYASQDGVTWTLIAGPMPINMPADVYIGLVVSYGFNSPNPGGSFDNVAVTSATSSRPTITSVSATTGMIGSQVTIHGTGFGDFQNSSIVVLNLLPTTINSWTDTTITITIPDNATSGYLSVLVGPDMNSSNGVPFSVTAQPLPTSWLNRDIGSVGLFGSATYNNDVFTANGAGTSIGSSSDGFHFVYQPLSSDGTITATVLSQSTNSQAGVMVRASLDAGSPNVFSFMSGATAYMKYRAAFGGPTSQATYGSAPLPYRVRVVRHANTYTAYVSAPGSNWMQVGVPQTFVSGHTVYVGLGVSSGSTLSLATATFADVSITNDGSVPDPIITGLTPAIGAPGALVTISGTGFGSTATGNAVSFNGAVASIYSWSDTQITAYVPEAAATGPVSITVGGITYDGPAFTLAFVAHLTDSLGNASDYAASTAGSQWVMTEAQGAGCSSCSSRGTIYNQFDSKGNLLWTTDALGRSTIFRYDSSNNLTSQSAQIDLYTSAKTSYTYNSFGEVLTVTDALGKVTTNTYDANGNLTSVTTPAPNGSTAASVTQFAYDTKGQLTQITDPLNHITKIAYNSAGLIQSITDANNKVTSYEYDLRGNRTAVVDSFQHRTEFAYDSGSRLTTITYPDTTTTIFDYDYRGRRTSVTDPNSNVTTYAYDDADRLISVTDAAQNVTQYGYDTENNLTSITDAKSRVTSFQYDGFGRVTETDFPSYSETYGYDAVGNLTSKTDRNGQTITYVYDALNRLTHKGYPDSTGADYVYDLVGKIKQVTDPTGTYGFSYDNMGRLIGTTTQYSFLPSRTFSNTYGYDKASNRTGYTDPESGTVGYGYDALNRLTSLSSSVAGNFGFGYDDLSRRTSLTRPNAVSTDYVYDDLSRLTSVTHKANGTTTIDGAGYAYDNAGNRIGKGNFLTGTMSSYSYDDIYQLRDVHRDSTLTENYTYDEVGNRLTSADVASYSYNSSNQLTAADATSFTYDHNGNTTTKTDNNGQTTYAWDYENRLTSVTLPGGGGVVSFKYDPFGRRIQKSSGSGTTIYVYDGANDVEELNGSGAVVARYVQGAGIDEPLAQSRSGLSYYNADGLGSITSLTDSTGTPTATFVYGAFGVLNSSTGTTANPYRYTAREYDSETGLYYYRARYYDSNFGRFINEDPVRFWAGIDFYKYVDNQPVNHKDPSGEMPVYGWWCGPNWTGGKFEMYDPAHGASYKKPVNATDDVCMHHDMCYYECRKSNPCDKGARTACMRRCDGVLIANMPRNWAGPLIGFGIDVGNDPPDAGEDDKSCRCKSDQIRQTFNLDDVMRQLR